VGGFTLDDTILPTGELFWSAPGGNALYSAIGAKIWGVPVGIVARVGADYPVVHLERLAAAGFNLTGVSRIDGPTFHVWILHEGQGRRQIVYRLDSGRNMALDPVATDIPTDYLTAEAAHICPILNASQAALACHLAKFGVPTYVDLIAIPGQIDLSLDSPPSFWKGLRAFLPSLEEVTALWGDLPLDQLIDKLRHAGPPCFAIKMGDKGSVVYDPDRATLFHVPVYPAEVVDTTGAGDAYCGGFMVGLQETGDPLEAALYGTVSASIVIEGFGALHALDHPAGQQLQRLQALRSRAYPVQAIPDHF
jgi:sugar/nucleoside kinase (ribokinase family)